MVLAACTPSAVRPRPLLTGPAQTADAADPSTLPFREWSAIDRAVSRGCLEHLVVATPVEAIGGRYRTYTLLGPHDQPGELRVERTAGAAALTLRLGRFGLPELEAAVLRSVAAELARTD